MVQNIIVFIILTIVALLIVRFFFRLFIRKNDSSCGGCNSCDMGDRCPSHPKDDAPLT